LGVVCQPGFRRTKQAGGMQFSKFVRPPLKERQDGFRRTPGTGDLIHIPPQDGAEILALMAGLERFLNDDEACTPGPLIKMALIHHQFESIHPFPDGNGRIGRILNVLYLARTGLLEIPILYLSVATSPARRGSIIACYRSCATRTARPMPGRPGCCIPCMRWRRRPGPRLRWWKASASRWPM